MEKKKLFRSKKVLLEDGLQEAGILVDAAGKIVNIFTAGDLKRDYSDVEVVDVGELVVMAGVVDSHVHVNEPGRTEWEGFATATMAAAAGGITTIVDMPLNSIPPTTTLENFKVKLQVAKGKIYVDVAFWGGVIPGNRKELRGLIDAGVVGFKCFLCPSGVDEFPHVTTQDVEDALQELRGTNSVLAFHAECDLDNQDVVANKGDPFEYETFLKSRPPEMETTAIKLVAELCKKYSVRCHVVHLSACEALPSLMEARECGALLTAETCHHYLTLAAETVPRRAMQYKCCPPVRGQQNRERLWAALRDGQLDMVVSDHSPCTPQLKHLGEGEGHFLSAWGGISSLQFGLSLFWTQARRRGFSLADVSQLLSQSPAKLCGLQDRKGSLKPGLDADMVIWDPNSSFEITESIIHHKHKITPYIGMKLDGLVVETIVRGRTVYANGKHLSVSGQIMSSSNGTYIL